MPPPSAMSSNHRKRASVGAFRPPRDSKQLEDREAPTINTKRSFQNLRQLFKLPARVLSPFSSKDKDEPRGRAPMVNQTEPKTHRLMGPISPTRTRHLVPSSSTVPNLRALAARNASNTHLPPPPRNISEPVPSLKPPKINYATRPRLSSLRSSYTMNDCAPASRNISTDSLAVEVDESDATPVSSARRAFTDITRRINSPQRHFPRLSLARNTSTSSFLSVPYTSVPTTATAQQNSPPRPVFTNGKRPGHRAQRSLSLINNENKRNSYGGGRPRALTSKSNLPTTAAPIDPPSFRLARSSTRDNLSTTSTVAPSLQLRRTSTRDNLSTTYTSADPPFFQPRGPTTRDISGSSTYASADSPFSQPRGSAVRDISSGTFASIESPYLRPREPTARDSLSASYALTASACLRPSGSTTRDSSYSYGFTNPSSLQLRESEATTASSAPITRPETESIPRNPRCIYNSQPHAYWAGRFSALHDQYHTQMLCSTSSDEKIRQSFIRPSNIKPGFFQSEVQGSNASNINPENSFQKPKSTEAMEYEEIRRCKRVFFSLQSFCVTDEAKQSLWGFQLRFARERKMEGCLPDGGTMQPATLSRTWNRLSRGMSLTIEDDGLIDLDEADNIAQAL